MFSLWQQAWWLDTLHAMYCNLHQLQATVATPWPPACLLHTMHAIHWANLKDVAVSDTFCVYELPLVAFRFLTLLLWWPLCLQAPTLNQLGTCPTSCHVMCNGWRHRVSSVMLLFETWWWARCDLPHVIGCMLCYLAFMSFLMLHLRHVLCHFSIMHWSICGHHWNIMNNSSKSFSFILWHHFWWHSSEAMSAPDVPDPRGTLAAAQSLRSSLRERFSTNLSNLNIKNTCSLVISGCSPDLSADECLWWI